MAKGIKQRTRVHGPTSLQLSTQEIQKVITAVIIINDINHMISGSTSSLCFTIIL